MAERPLPLDVLKVSLGVEPQTDQDRMLGTKVTFAMEGLSFSVFPDRGIVHVETKLSSLDLAGVSAITEGPYPGSVHIDAENDQEKTKIELSAYGVIFSSKPKETPPPVAAPSEEAMVAPQPQEQKEKEKAKSIVGIVAKKLPSRKTQQNEVDIASIILYEHQEDGKTVSHKVVAFGERAPLLEQLTVGQKVLIKGYPHEQRWVDKKTGQERKETQIYVVVVQQNLPKDSS